MDIRISVRNLVEFIERSGDIDNRHKGKSKENIMLEGAEAHRMLQRSAEGDYVPEVSLAYKHEDDGFNLIIEGRADGIITDGDEVTVDEIKSTYKRLERIKEADRIHLAQARCYAFMYANSHFLDRIGVRITYCNLETYEVKRFEEFFEYDEIEEWFLILVNKYARWARYEYESRAVRQASIHKTEFPFAYREGQKKLATDVYSTIYHEKKLFIEAPTGVGKTITTVFPAVKAIGEGKGDKIFYLTAKTITRTVAKEAFDVLRAGGLKFKTVILTAKEKICVCEEMNCDPVHCERAAGHYDRINDAIYDIITHEDDFSREKIEEYAAKHMVCPFEFALDVSLFADGIICDYNYLFDPHAYLRRFFFEGHPDEYLFLIDEAHNLVDRGREMYSASICKEEVLAIKKEVEEIYKAGRCSGETLEHYQRIIRRLEQVNKELLLMKKTIPDNSEGSIYYTEEEFATLTSKMDKLFTQLSSYFESAEESGPLDKHLLEFYFNVSHFMATQLYYDEFYRAYSTVDDEGRTYFKMCCINPGKRLRECMDKGRSSILFSATLLPIQYYKNLLGGRPDDYEVYANSVFSPEQMGIYISEDTTSRYTARDRDLYHRIALYIEEVASCKEGNYMVFFPSYEFASRVYEIYESTWVGNKNIRCILQHEGMSESDRENFLNAFKESRDGSLIAFCILGGIFGEGIDLAGESLIGVIIVGNGMPKPVIGQRILHEYFEESNGRGFEYAYLYPGMNKVLQAAGRVIRTVNDRGVVVLLEKRFTDSKYKQLFPREWTNIHMVNEGNVAEKVNQFWNTCDSGSKV